MAPKDPFFNLIAAGLPVLAILIGLGILAGTRSGTGDFNARMGSGVLFLFAIGGACAAGEVCAWVALLRGEKMLWLSVLAAVLNGLVLLPMAGLLMRE